MIVKSSLFGSRALNIIALISFLVPPSISAYVIYSSPKLYEAKSLVVFNPGRSTNAIVSGGDDFSRTEQITYDQVIRSQLSFIMSDDVLRCAINKTGGKQLFPDLPAQSGRSDPEEIYQNAVASNLSATAEANTFVLKIVFRNQDRKLAKKLTDSVVDCYLEKRAAIYANPAAEKFYSDQENQYALKLDEANRELEKFSQKFRVWDVPEQRSLLLKRKEESTKSLVDTQGLIKKRTSELESLRSAISSLKMKLSLPQEIFGPNNFGSEKQATADIRVNDPPLLNLKLYQQMSEKLVDANTDLAGLQALEISQARNIADMDNQLKQISAVESKFNELKKSLKRYDEYINSLSKKSIDARINNAYGLNENFSSAQVLQKAVVSSQPVYPKPVLFMLAGLTAGIVLAAVLYLSRLLKFAIAELMASAPQSDRSNSFSLSNSN